MGWFEFLIKPKSLDEIISQFEVEDEFYLKDLLETLLSDKTIIKTKNGQYQCLKTPVIMEKTNPSFFNDSIKALLWSDAKFIPRKLKGENIAFAGEMNLFDWDSSLSLFMYQQIRKAAFQFVDPRKSPGKLLDIGCGNGFQTAGTWVDFFKAGLFNGDNKTRLYGLEYDEGLLNIAKDEFPRMIKRHIDLPEEEIRQYQSYFPEFFSGSIAKMPFEDNFFNYAYASQVLHWTDPKESINELYRILQPGGIAFGTESFLGQSDLYTNLHIKIIENAYGFFGKNAMTKWVTDAGFRAIFYATPVTLFKFVK